MILLICLFLLIISILLSVYFKFPQKEVFKEISKKENRKSFQALLISLASHIGTGNLVGVTTGIILGGPGIIFWMWIYGLFGSILSYIENQYAIIYQEEKNEEVFSGAPYYIKKGLNNNFISFLFAGCLFILNIIVFPPIQINSVVYSLKYFININPIYFGIIIVIIFVLFVYRGTKHLLKITDLLVPIMSIVFLLTLILIITLNINFLPSTLLKIFNSAFNIQTFGISAIINTFTVGISRSIFSSEAGLGTTPSFSGINNGIKPKTQGLFQMFGVYLDTLIMCTLMGVAIIICLDKNNANLGNFEGPDLILYVFHSFLGKTGIILAVFFLFTFPFASLLGEYYMSRTNLLFIFKDKRVLFIFKILFSLMILFGTTYSIKTAMEIADVSILIIGILNLFILYKLFKKKPIT